MHTSTLHPGRSGAYVYYARVNLDFLTDAHTVGQHIVSCTTLDAPNEFRYRWKA